MTNVDISRTEPDIESFGVDIYQTSEVSSLAPERGKTRKGLKTDKGIGSGQLIWSVEKNLNASNDSPSATASEAIVGIVIVIHSKHSEITPTTQ